MKNLTIEHITRACGGTYCGPRDKAGCTVSAITTDSRKVEKACLFVPIKGERSDGHDYIPSVMEQGALVTLTEIDLGEQPYPYIRVGSSLQAVKDIAQYYLAQLNIPVVGITGSVGKTSTKEVIASVLEQKYRTLKTAGNFNNELGLPLTVFRLRDEDEIAVLEMGISDFGEMTRLAKIARPSTCVITNIGQCHLENLGDRDGVLKAKTEVFDYLKDNGTVILNGDDDKLCTVAEVQGKKPVFFGMHEHCAVYADELENMGLKGVACTIHTGGESFRVQIPIPGRHMVYNALAGTAVGRVYGLSLEQIKNGIESLQSLGGRFHIIETGDYTIIDDCYNANPASMQASLAVLRDALGRKVAILGDMGELGADEAALHRGVGEFAASTDIDMVICVGPLCANMAEGIRANNSKMEVIHFDTRDELLEKLPNLIKKGDTLLVKASHFMQFEKVVAALQP